MSKKTYATLTGVEHSDEKGLMSIAIHLQDFVDYGYIYMYYSKGGSFRISRFSHVENGGGLTSRLDISSELILWKDPKGYGCVETRHAHNHDNNLLATVSPT